MEKVDELCSQAEIKMQKALEALRKELITLRTGRASPGLVDHLLVDYYGAPTPLQQLANIAIPDARLIVIQPWDRQILTNIEKAILKSDLGLNPTNDGQVIRLVIPHLTGERRKELVKSVHKKVEEGKVAVRNVRRDAVEHIKALEKEKVISEDEQKRTIERLQKLTDRFIAEVELMGETKEKELLQI